MTQDKAGIIFITAFIINLFWESLHYRLYIPMHPIVQIPWITIGAAFLDAVWILGIFIFFKSGDKVKILAAVLLALIIEQWAVLFEVWAYRESMPLVPILGSGISPTLQLAATIIIVIWVLKIRNNNFKQRLI